MFHRCVVFSAIGGKNVGGGFSDHLVRAQPHSLLESTVDESVAPVEVLFGDHQRRVFHDGVQAVLARAQRRIGFDEARGGGGAVADLAPDQGGGEKERHTQRGGEGAGQQGDVPPRGKDV